MKHLFLIVMLGGMLLLTSCQRPSLTCRTEFLTPPYLASEQVDTPDPRRECFVGQQVIVYWRLPVRYLQEPVTLKFHVRYGTREDEIIEVPINRPRGYWVYRLLNKKYWCMGGMISYKAELYQDGRMLNQWRHHLWTEIIEIAEEPDCIE